MCRCRATRRSPGSSRSPCGGASRSHWRRRSRSRRRSRRPGRPVVAAGRDARQDVRVLDEAQDRRPLAVLLQLLAGLGLDPPVGNGGRHDRDIDRQRRLARRQHLPRGLDRDQPDPGRGRLLGRPRDQHGLGPQRGQRGGDRVPLLARGMVRQVSHRVDRLARRAACHQRAPAGEPPDRGSGCGRSRPGSRPARTSGRSRFRRTPIRRRRGRPARRRAPSRSRDWPGSPDAPTSSRSSPARSAPACRRRAASSPRGRRPVPPPCARSGRRWPARRRRDRPRATGGCGPSRSRRSATRARRRPCPRSARRPIAASRTDAPPRSSQRAPRRPARAAGGSARGSYRRRCRRRRSAECVGPQARAASMMAGVRLCARRCPAARPIGARTEPSSTRIENQTSGQCCSRREAVSAEESMMKTTLGARPDGRGTDRRSGGRRKPPADPGSERNAAEAERPPPLYQMKAGQWRASKLDGLDVYNTNNEKIGDISELILDRGGKIEAIVIGVGGFLGMGEHQVAVPFDKVQWVDQPRSTRSPRRRHGAPAVSGTSTARSRSRLRRRPRRPQDRHDGYNHDRHDRPRPPATGHGVRPRRRTGSTRIPIIVRTMPWSR